MWKNEMRVDFIVVICRWTLALLWYYGKVAWMSWTCICMHFPAKVPLKKFLCATPEGCNCLQRFFINYIKGGEPALRGPSEHLIWPSLEFLFAS